MQISPIPTLSEDINDIRTRTANIVAEKIIPNEREIYSKSENASSIRNEIRKEVQKEKLWAPHLPEEYGGMGIGFMAHAYMNEILAWSPLSNRLFGVIAPTQEIKKYYLNMVQKNKRRNGLNL